MERLIELPIEIKDSKHHPIVNIDVDDSKIPDWCLNLCLLEKSLLSAVVISDSDLFKLKVRTNPKIKQSERGKVFWKNKSVELTISQTELETWIYFFLKYYRDSQGDVDHIDLDIYSEAKKSEGIYLELRASKAKPPMSPEEALRLIGPP